MACSISSSTPSSFEADIGMTGTPSMTSNLFTFIVPPFSLTSSIMFNAMTMGIFSSKSCKVRKRFLSMFVASIMFIMPSGLSLRRKSRVTISSLVKGDSEYIPGRSTTVAFSPLILPSFLSTVTPGKFPTCWLDPVSWLNKVVFPQFWFPASAKMTSFCSGIAIFSFGSW